MGIVTLSVCAGCITPHISESMRSLSLMVEVTIFLWVAVWLADLVFCVQNTGCMLNALHMYIDI